MNVEACDESAPNYAFSGVGEFYAAFLRLPGEENNEVIGVPGPGLIAHIDVIAEGEEFSAQGQGPEQSKRAKSRDVKTWKFEKREICHASEAAAEWYVGVNSRPLSRAGGRIAGHVSLERASL